MRNYGQAHNYEVTQFGLNSRLDEIQAAILNVKLKYLESNIKKRQSNAQKYFNCLSNGLVELLKMPEDIQQHAYHLYVLKVKSRSSFMAYLKSHNIQSVIHYPILCFDQKFDFTYRKDPEGTANAILFGETCISIPISHLLSGEEQNYIIEVINKYEK